MRDRLTAELPRLRRFARALARDRDAADELVQVAVERALRGLAALRSPDRLRAWCFQIIYRAYIDRLAAGWERMVPLEAVDPASLAISPGIEERIDAERVLAALHRLDPDQRAAIAATAIEGLSYREAAALLGIAEGTLMSRIHRGRQRLRAMMAHDPAAPTASRPVPRIGS